MELEIGEPLAALCVEQAYTQQAKETDCLNGLRCVPQLPLWLSTVVSHQCENHDSHRSNVRGAFAAI